MNTVCPTTSAGRDPNREDVADAFEDGIAEGYKLHWRPSEEQMEALEKAWLEYDGKETSVVLSSLMLDLQKLL